MTQALDLGYRHVKACDLTGKPQLYDSLIADLVGSTAPTPNSKSALIEYLESNNQTNAALIGKRWLVGSSARNMGNYKQAAISEKVDIALKLALPASCPQVPLSEFPPSTPACPAPIATPPP